MTWNSFADDCRKRTANLPEQIDPFRHRPLDTRIPPMFDQTPDQPEPVGCKVSWLALKASDPAAVLDAFELGEAVPATGRPAWPLYTGGSSAVGPLYRHLNGWVLAISVSWPYPTIERTTISAQYSTSCSPT